MKLREKLIHLRRTVKFSHIEQGKEKECRYSKGSPTSANSEKKEVNIIWDLEIWIPDVENSSVLPETCRIISCKYSGKSAKARQTSVRNKD